MCLAEPWPKSLGPVELAMVLIEIDTGRLVLVYRYTLKAKEALYVVE